VVVIDVPGQEAGTADQNLGSTTGSARDPGLQGSLLGYLQRDQNDNVTFVSADYLPFDTMAPGSTATQVVMSVGGATYTSAQLPAGQAGFFVLVLDAGNADPLVQDTFAVSGSGLSDSDQATNLDTIAGLMNSFMDDPTRLFLIQSIGSVQRVDNGDPNTAFTPASAWNDLVQQQTNLGGHGYYLNMLQPTNNGNDGTYAFVGPGDPPGYLSPWSATSSEQATGTPGHLTKLLTRTTGRSTTPSSPLEHAGGRSASADRFPVHRVVARPQGHAGPCRCTCLHHRRAGLAGTDREQLLERDAFDSIQTALTRLNYSPPPHPPSCQNQPNPFTLQDFDDVQNQLETEMLYGQGVTNLITI
jgi:hypothetical protein